MGNKRDNILVDNMDIKVITTLEERIIPALYDYVYIVKDDVYDKISGSTSSFCAFNVESYKDTLNICKNYEGKFGESNNKKDHIILMKANILESHKIGYGVIMFLTIFIGIIFFVTTGSFLYNKYYMDVQQDRMKYEQLNKIGITFKEIKKYQLLKLEYYFVSLYCFSNTFTICIVSIKNAFEMDVNLVAFL